MRVSILRSSNVSNCRTIRDGRATSIRLERIEGAQYCCKKVKIDHIKSILFPPRSLHSLRTLVCHTSAQSSARVITPHMFQGETCSVFSWHGKNPKMEEVSCQYYLLRSEAVVPQRLQGRS